MISVGGQRAAQSSKLVNQPDHTPDPRLPLGAVLTGGHSLRFGRDKAREPLLGVTMAARAVATLKDVLPDVVTVTREGATPPLDRDVPAIADARKDCGPIAGLEAALTEARARGLTGAFVLACDLPLVTIATVRALVRLWLDGKAPAVAPLTGASTGEPFRRTDLQPLCAVYSCSVLKSVSEACASGRLSLHRLFKSVGGLAVELPEIRENELLNVNTQQALTRAGVLLEKRDGAYSGKGIRP